MGNHRSRLPVLLSIVAIVAVVVAFGRHPTGSPVNELTNRDFSESLVLRRTVPLSVGQSQTAEVPFAAKPLVPINPAERGLVRPGAVSAGTPPTEQPRNAALPPSVPASRVAPSRAVPRPQAHLIGSPVPIQVDSLVIDETMIGGPRYHRIVEGDTLDGLAATYFGNPDRFLEIFHANLGVLTRPDVLPLGVRILIPPREPIRVERAEYPGQVEIRPPAIETPTPPPQAFDRPAAVGTSFRPMVRIGD